MKNNFFKNIKTFYILLVPESSSRGTRSRKIQLNHLIMFISLYTLMAGFIGFLIFRATPVNYIVFPGSSSLKQEDMEVVSQLNKRMLFLTRELESLKSTNERLKYAIILGDSTLLDSLKKKDKEPELRNGQKYGGNIFAVVKKIFSQEDEVIQQKIIYFDKPINGFISREFNPEKGHMGIDFVVKSGTPVYASANGYVIFAGYTNNDGNMLIIGHPDNYITVYKHCSTLIKKERDMITQGELIALSGNTGKVTTGPHLHFEIWKDGQPVNPISVLINY